MKFFKYFSVSLAIIILDQVVKLSVYKYMDMGLPGEIHLLGDFFKLHYTLNPGMAFGVEFGTQYGKLSLTLFRLFAMFGISYYMIKLIKQNAPNGYVLAVAAILGGAIGNLIDSTFYGVLLDNAPFEPTLPPFYPLFHGQVIDMFYLDIWSGYLPDAIPVFGGTYLSLWPIFNIADAAIFIAVIVILLNQKRFFEHGSNSKLLKDEVVAKIEPEN